jgi:hypothetical protein
LLCEIAVFAVLELHVAFAVCWKIFLLAVLALLIGVGRLALTALAFLDSLQLLLLNEAGAHSGSLWNRVVFHHYKAIVTVRLMNVVLVLLLEWYAGLMLILALSEISVLNNLAG